MKKAHANGTIKLWLALVLVMLGPLFAQAQGPSVGAPGTIDFTVVDKFDADSTTFTYCVTGPVRPGPGTISTSGSSTTTTGSSNALLDTHLNVGDRIWVTDASGNRLSRYVSAIGSETSITVEARGGADAWNLPAGTQWRFANVTCGTALTNGWFDVTQFLKKVPKGDVTMIVQVDQQNTDAAGLDLRWECKGSGENAAPVQVCPATNGTVTNVLEASAGIGGRYACYVDLPFNQCRVGVKINTADDGVDTGADSEQINIYVSGR